MNYLQSIKMFCFLFGEKRKNMIKETNAKTLKAVEAASEETTEVEDIELHLKPSEAEIIRDLLNNFVYAYRSDREVDYKRELVPRDKVGNYPYVAEPADPSIINPTYDWVNKKWYSKSGSTSLPEIAQAVKTLQSNQQAGTTQSLAMTKAVKELKDGQADQNKLLASMQQLMLALAGNKQPSTPAQPSTETTDTKQENGGN